MKIKFDPDYRITEASQKLISMAGIVVSGLRTIGVLDDTMEPTLLVNKNYLAIKIEIQADQLIRSIDWTDLEQSREPRARLSALVETTKRDLLHALYGNTNSPPYSCDLASSIPVWQRGIGASCQ